MNNYSSEFALDIVGGSFGKTNSFSGYKLLIGIAIVVIIAATIKFNNRNENIVPFPVNPCNLNKENRPCGNYNILYHQGEKVICPPGFQLDDRGICYLQKYGTGNCGEWDWSTQCDPRNYNIPCYGKWPNNQWAVPNAGVKEGGGRAVMFQGGKWETNAIPASMVCR